MTSQIGMVNKNSVALASDSAVTWGGVVGNSYNTSEKIYQLAGRQPVGFMSCGLGEYMGISWGRILGIYRERRGVKVKDKMGKWIVDELNHITNLERISENPIYGDEVKDLKEHKKIGGHLYKRDPKKSGYVEDFIDFLDKEPCLQSEDEENESMLAEIEEYIEFSNPQFKALKDHVSILEDFDYNVANVPSNVSVTADAIHERQEKLWKQFSELFVDGLIGFSDWLYKRIDPDKQIECDRVTSEESELIKYLCNHYRSKMYEARISRKMRKALGTIVGCYIAEKMWRHSPSGSGMVIAGFGKSEETPAMVELHIRSKWKGEMRYSIEGIFEPDCAVPFAQAEQIHTILEGLSPRVYSRIRRNLRDELPKLLFGTAHNTPGVGPVTREKLLQTLTENDHIPDLMMGRLLIPSDEEIKKHSSSGNIGPIDILRLGPPDLAELAEKFVDLESTIQYVHYGLGASVGGEIDVASITKEDGLVWVKRKNKIDEDLNPRVFRSARDRASHI